MIFFFREKSPITTTTGQRSTEHLDNTDTNYLQLSPPESPQIHDEKKDWLRRRSSDSPQTDCYPLLNPLLGSSMYQVGQSYSTESDSYYLIHPNPYTSTKPTNR